MSSILAGKISKGASARIYASYNDGGQIRMACIGSYDEVRHRYNQMACLIGAAVMERLLTFGASAVHSRAATPGTWVGRWDGKPLGTPGELFSMAASAPSDAADLVGFNTWHSDWPFGIDTLLSGFKSMMKCTTEVSGIFYGYDFKSTVQVGCSQDISAAKRTREAIARAKQIGYAIYEEDALQRFLDTLEKARFLHFFHQVNLD